MGEAQRRLTEGSKVVTVDLTAPVLSIMKGDRDVLTKETISGLTPDQTATSKAVRLAISAVVQASFPQGMAKAARRQIKSGRWEWVEAFLFHAGSSIGQCLDVLRQ